VEEAELRGDGVTNVKKTDGTDPLEIPANFILAASKLSPSSANGRMPIAT